MESKIPYQTQNLEEAVRLEALWEQHYQLTIQLEHFRYRQFRTSLPADFKPSLAHPGADRFLKPLLLDEAERIDLETEIAATEMQIIDLAAEIHRIKYREVPGWLQRGLKEQP